MPRKTKQQKLKAAQRRESSQSRPDIVKREFEFSFADLKTSHINKIEDKKHDKSFSFSNSASTARDLIKTVIFAIIIFSLEIMIYFAWFKKSGLGYHTYQLITNFVDKL